MRDRRFRGGGMRLQGPPTDDPAMHERQSQTGKARAPRLRPLDHLRPGERPLADPRPDTSPPPDHDAGDGGGETTRSTAAIETREHLEGSEQGPA